MHHECFYFKVSMHKILFFCVLIVQNCVYFDLFIVHIAIIQLISYLNDHLCSYCSVHRVTFQAL